VWDSLALSEIVGTNLAMQQRLLAKYLVSARAQAASLHRAAQAQDTPTVTGLAHTLKSASRTVGAMALGALCQQLEAAGAADDGPLCTTLGAQVPAAFMQAETKIAAALRFPVSTPVGS